MKPAIYHDYATADPPHQPMYLELMLAELSSSTKTRRILDAGCGDGNFASSLAEHGFRVHGIDQSRGGIEIAGKRPGITVTQGSLYDDLLGPFGLLDPYDAIVSVEVIEHLYSPATFAERAFEALRPGGLLILTTPYWGYLKNIALAVTNRLDRSLTALWEGGHIKHWSYRTLRTLGEQSGFEFLSFHGCGRPTPHLWNGMMMVFRRPPSGQGSIAP